MLGQLRPGGFADRSVGRLARGPETTGPDVLFLRAPYSPFSTSMETRRRLKASAGVQVASVTRIQPRQRASGEARSFRGTVGLFSAAGFDLGRASG